MPEITPSRWLTTCGWDDGAPHLDEQAKRELLEATPPHLREARSQGIPSLGSGAVYPIPLGEISIAPFAIPAYWPRSYALDVGWNRTAGLWSAWDPSDGVQYCYAEHYRGQAEPSVHASAIRARGEWIKGVIDPAARGRGQDGGLPLLATYTDLGLNLTPADTRDVEAGLFDVFEGLSTGLIKIFTTLVNFRAEYRVYQRDANGRIVKKNDHLMDCLRMSRKNGRSVAKTRPVERIGETRGGVGDRHAGY